MVDHRPPEANPLLRTALFPVHVRLNARVVDFAGWDMPVQYPTGIPVEHRAVRERCGLFDLSHMGRVYLRGPDALLLAQPVGTRDLARLAPGSAAYSLLCTDTGGVMDDVIFYLIKEEEILVVVNASNRVRDVAHLQQHAKGLNVAIDDKTLTTVLIGVQGPLAEQTLQPLTQANLTALPGYAFTAATVLGTEGLIARTGYTGEDGFEVLVPAAIAEQLWDALLVQPTAPISCGLGARDTLRTEAGMPLYGHELSEEINPYQARLGWAVALKKATPFVGQEVLARLKERPGPLLVGLKLAPGGVARPGGRVLDMEGQPVGVLSSGTQSPTLGSSIALAFVPAELAEIGTALAVEVRNRPIPAQVVALPFVPHRSVPRQGGRRTAA